MPDNKSLRLAIYAFVIIGISTSGTMPSDRLGAKNKRGETAQYLESFYGRAGTEPSDEDTSRVVLDLAKDSDFAAKVALIYNSGDEGKDIVVGLLKRSEVIDAARKGHIEQYVSAQHGRYARERAVTQRIMRMYRLRLSPYEERNFTDASLCRSFGCNYEMLALHRIVDGMEDALLDTILLHVLRRHRKLREKLGDDIAMTAPFPFYYRLKMIKDHSSEGAVRDFLLKAEGCDQKKVDLYMRSLQCLDLPFEKAQTGGVKSKAKEALP